MFADCCRLSDAAPSFSGRLSYGRIQIGVAIRHEQDIWFQATS